MRESDLQRLIQLEATKLGARLFRNQVGSYLLADGRRLSSGLAVGSSDLIGWITRSDGVAQFVAVEIKSTSGRAGDHQLAWIECVRKAGGIAGIVRSVDDLRALLGVA